MAAEIAFELEPHVELGTPKRLSLSYSYTTLSPLFVLESPRTDSTITSNSRSQAAGAASTGSGLVQGTFILKLSLSLTRPSVCQKLFISLQSMIESCPTPSSKR